MKINRILFAAEVLEPCGGQPRKEFRAPVYVIEEREPGVFYIVAANGATTKCNLPASVTYDMSHEDTNSLGMKISTQTTKKAKSK